MGLVLILGCWAGMAGGGFPVFALRAVGVSFLFVPGLPIFFLPFPLGLDLGPDGGTAVPLSWGSSLVA